VAVAERPEERRGEACADRADESENARPRPPRPDRTRRRRARARPSSADVRADPASWSRRIAGLAKIRRNAAVESRSRSRIPLTAREDCTPSGLCQTRGKKGADRRLVGVPFVRDPTRRTPVEDREKIGPKTRGRGGSQEAHSSRPRGDETRPRQGRARTTTSSSTGRRTILEALAARRRGTDEGRREPPFSRPEELLELGEEPEPRRPCAPRAARRASRRRRRPRPCPPPTPSSASPARRRGAVARARSRPGSRTGRAAPSPRA
jgi:hypothetical protein